MNLAFKDIRFNPLRFLLTALGVGFLMMSAMGMVGLYRGIVADALLVIQHIGADLWVVQGGRRGPFSEGSAISYSMDRRAEGLAGVAGTRRFVQFSQQFTVRGQQLRASVTGLDFPKDQGRWIPMLGGRRLSSGHYEAVADESIGLVLGESVHLGEDDYTIVGLAQGMVDISGDGILFVSINDAVAIAERRTSEEVLLARGSAGPAAANRSSVPQDSKIAAVLVRLNPAVDPGTVRRALSSWGDVSVLSRAEQEDLLLNQRLWRLRVQILAFTGVLLAVTGIVVSLIIYMLTMEKLHEIAMLKLIGADNSVIILMIAQQAFLIGAAGQTLGLMLSQVVFPFFPRKVLILPQDVGLLGGAVALICALASLIGISRALKVRAQEILS